MTGTLAQIIALTAFGNDFLENGSIPEDFNAANRNFQFCNKVVFRESKKQSLVLKPKEIVIANSPTDWFEYLKKEGCRHLRLYFEHSKDPGFAEEHGSAGLVGGGDSWLIEAVHDGHSNYWANSWEVTAPNAPEGKIWTVNYRMTVKEQHTSNLQVDHQKIKEELRKTLTEIADFAFKKDLRSWGEQFDKAKLVLDSSTPERSHYPTDLIPVDRYSLTAKQVIFSAASAWVFGGMGSWNDLDFERKEDNGTHGRLSQELYSNITEAIIAGINSY